MVYKDQSTNYLTLASIEGSYVEVGDESGNSVSHKLYSTKKVVDEGFVPTMDYVFQRSYGDIYYSFYYTYRDDSERYLKHYFTPKRVLFSNWKFEIWVFTYSTNTKNLVKITEFKKPFWVYFPRSQEEWDLLSLMPKEDYIVFDYDD